MRTQQSAHKTQAENPVFAHVGGWAINVRNLNEAVSKLASSAERGEGFLAVTINLDLLVKLRSNEAFRNAVSKARFVTADGAPVARLARRQNAGIERTTGADLIVPLTKAAAERGLPIYLFGASDDALGEAAADLAERCDGKLDVVGTWSPSRNFDPEGPEADEAIDRIARSGARICFLALGAPKQEIFAARALARGCNVGFVACGAAVDFLARRQIRAPQFMQDHGLEWLWRLSTNPRRLAARYAQCALLLADLEIVEPLRARGRGLMGAAQRAG